jgi:hypothetical protein
MTSSCDHVAAYLDDTLSDLNRARFERHLIGCARCQGAVDDFMQLVAAGAELSRRFDRPRPAIGFPLAGPAQRRAVSRWRLAAGAAASAIAVAAVVMVVRPSDAALGNQIAATLAPTRTIRERLPYAPLDRYRRYDVARGAQPVESISSGLAAKVEDQGSPAALVAVLLARGDVPQAIHTLERAGAGDALDIERAMVASKQNPAEALRRLDGVLARSPNNGVAAWNRALLMTDLRLPLAAEEALVRVASLAEPGWSIEAIQRAVSLRHVESRRLAQWKTAKQACERLSASALPDRATVRAATTVCRPAFYEAVRVTASRDVPKLLPIAEELDAAAGSSAATTLVRRVAAVAPGQRARAVAAYSRLIAAPAPADRKRLLDQLRASHQDDLILGAITRLKLGDLEGEYAKLARASGDPYFVEQSEQLAAEARVAAEDPLGAEVMLRRAVRECTSRDVELRCAYLQIALAEVYATMHRPSDIRAVALTGLARSSRLGVYWDERHLFDLLAEAARLEGQTALMRAYLREATLRSQGECEQDRYAQETLAMANLGQLDFAQARQDLTVAPLCGALPNPDRARVFAELARIDGTPAEAAAWRADLARMRAQPGIRPGQQAYLDAIEGRLVAARDATAARPLLRRAIAAADQIGTADAEAAKARHDAYTSLLVLSAAEPDHAASLALLAEAAGTPLGRACAVGVMVDAERVLVVARDAAGTVTQRFDARARTTPVLDAAALVPAPLIQSLASCERIDVLALAPVFGLPNLLPPELAWSYRGRPTRVTTPPARPARVVTVADTVPPPELELARLQTLSLAALPGATHHELRGAEATPARVVGAFAGADAIEIHAHGFIDLGVSDASLIALSPQADGRFTLGAREIAGLRLPRAPLVLLAACHAAYTAPYFHEPWGLPRAFLLAGARAVIASPDTISDGEAGGFFRTIEQRILDGVDPAIALRDERRAWLARDPASWTRSVLLFD